jgi:hypothetical protein
MNLIKNNPFRVVGVLSDSSVRELQKQSRRLSQFLSAGQQPDEDYSFPDLAPLNRRQEDVDQAVAKLNLDQDKMTAALFWFINGYPISDEPAFESLKAGNEDEAIGIWRKLIASGEVTKRNFSAFHNLSSLLLLTSINGGSIDFADFERALTLKISLLESDHFKDLKEKVTDATFSISKSDAQLLFLNGIQNEVGNSGRLSPSKFISILSNLDFSAKDGFLRKFSDALSQQVEKRIQSAKAARKSNKAGALNAGRSLYDDILPDLGQLGHILGKGNITYANISDKVSDEVLQCGIDYFTHYRDTNTDPGSDAMDLFRKADKIAIGQIAKQRCRENIENLQEWIDEKPEREKQSKVINDLEKLKNLIDQYDKKPETIANGKLLLLSAKPHLANVKSVLGNSDEIYLVLSTRIASDAQGMCVSEINKFQERIANIFDNRSKILAIFELKQLLDQAWEVTTLIGAMDLRSDFRSRYQENKNSLMSLRNQLAQLNTSPSRSTSSSGSGGCYIATMAYGNYDHAQVMVLRNFRDNVLTKYVWGRWFIDVYYRISPILVSVLKDQKTVHRVVRVVLDQFIKTLKK